MLYFYTSIHLVHLGLRGVASLHSYTPPALCSIVVAQLLHLQETYTTTLCSPQKQNWRNILEEEGDATGIRLPFKLLDIKDTSLRAAGIAEIIAVKVSTLFHVPLSLD